MGSFKSGWVRLYINFCNFPFTGPFNTYFCTFVITDLQIPCLQNGFLPWIWSCEKKYICLQIWTLGNKGHAMKHVSGVEVRIYTERIWKMVGILLKWTARVFIQSLKLNIKVFFFSFMEKLIFFSSKMDLLYSSNDIFYLNNLSIIKLYTYASMTSHVYIHKRSKTYKMASWWVFRGWIEKLVSNTTFTSKENCLCGSGMIINDLPLDYLSKTLMLWQNKFRNHSKLHLAV